MDRLNHLFLTRSISADAMYGHYNAVFVPTESVASVSPIDQTALNIFVASILIFIFIISFIVYFFKYFTDLELKNKNDFLEKS